MVISTSNIWLLDKVHDFRPTAGNVGTYHWSTLSMSIAGKQLKAEMVNVNVAWVSWTNVILGVYSDGHLYNEHH